LKYRSRADICTEILKITDGGASKTKIMYGAYLSFTQLKEYLKMLVDNGMLSFDEKTMQYRTTETGHNFVKMYERIDQMFDRRQMSSGKD
jgi:predicted transcriptional regulator